MAPADTGVVSRIDREAFGADRGFFLHYRLRLFPHLCKTLVNGNAISGFIMGQPGNGVVSIGPWLVLGDVEPVKLLESIAAEAGGDELRIGVLESNASALREMRALEGLTETEPSWRMVLGPDAGLGASERLFAIGSAAKG
jgi:hypothetical protein